MTGAFAEPLGWESWDFISPPPMSFSPPEFGSSSEQGRHGTEYNTAPSLAPSFPPWLSPVAAPPSSWQSHAQGTPYSPGAVPSVTASGAAGAPSASRLGQGFGPFVFNDQSLSNLFAATANIGPYAAPAMGPPYLAQQLDGHDPPMPPPPEPGPQATNALSRFQCHLCGEVFANAKNRDRHFLGNRHNAALPKFKCACGYTQARKDNHRRHLRGSCAFPAGSSYSCRCGSQTSDRNEHVAHFEYCGRKRRGRSQKP